MGDLTEFHQSQNQHAVSLSVVVNAEGAPYMQLLLNLQLPQHYERFAQYRLLSSSCAD